MTIGRAPICLGCQHFDRDRDDKLTCSAFPDGIPAAILNNQHDHRTPYRGDGGIVFSPVTPDDEAYADELFGDSTDG